MIMAAEEDMMRKETETKSIADIGIHTIMIEGTGEEKMTEIGKNLKEDIIGIVRKGGGTDQRVLKTSIEEDPLTEDDTTSSQI